MGQAQIPEASWKTIASALEAYVHGQRELLGATLADDEKKWVDDIARRLDRRKPQAKKTVKSAAEEAVPVQPPPSRVTAEDDLWVRLDTVEHTHTTELGPSLLAYTAWKELGLDECLQTAGFNPAQVAVACAETINRLVDPVSEHRLCRWVGSSSLPDLLGSGIEAARPDRYYRVSDKLVDHQAQIETHLRARHNQLGHLDGSVLLYDLTHTHFEGAGESNPKARRGHNKQGRDDGVQVVVGMVFDRNGFELTHRVFEGNKSDAKSLEQMITGLTANLPQDELPLNTRPLVILDGGIATRENGDLLKAKGLSYLVNESRRYRRRYQEEFAGATGWKEITGRAGDERVEIKSVKDEERGDLLLLCRSAGRRLKEEAIRSKAEERFLADLGKLEKRMASGKLRTESSIERAIGRVLAKHPRVQRFYKVEQKPAVAPASATLTWKRLEEEWKQAGAVLGHYILRTDLAEPPADEELWHLYMTLTRAEAGFRALKSDLGLRPNFHQVERRVDGHIFISVLAYQLQRHLLFQLEQQQDFRQWETIRRIVETHAYTTLIGKNRQGEVYRIRRSGLPEQQQIDIYNKLNVDWKRLRRPV